MAGLLLSTSHIQGRAKPEDRHVFNLVAPNEELGLLARMEHGQQQ